MFENPRRGRQAKNFTTNVPKILDLKSSSEKIFSENCRWVPLNENTGKWLKRCKLIVEEMKSDIGKFIVIYYRIFSNLTDVNYRIQTTNNVLLRDLNLMIP